MQLHRRSVEVEPGESVSLVVALPAAWPAPRTLVVLAHGAGNDMRQPLLVFLQERLPAHRLAVATFNFLYTEQGRRAPDRAPRLEACYRAVLAALRGDTALRPERLILGGKSMGGRIASHLAAQGEAAAPAGASAAIVARGEASWLHGLLFLGYPLHPAGKPERLRTAHLPLIEQPMLFISGSRDRLCEAELLRRTLESVQAPHRLHLIEAGDHSFRVPKSTGRDQAQVFEEILQLVVNWLAGFSPASSRQRGKGRSR